MSEGLPMQATVYIVDDDPAVRDVVLRLVESVGLTAAPFESADLFLESYEQWKCGCLVLDIRMPGMSGLELQEVLLERQITLPVIVISGHGDIPMAVETLKKGAVDFIEKPFRNQVLLDCINKAIEQDREYRNQVKSVEYINEKFMALTCREKEVTELIADGLSNKQIASQLHLSRRTVEAHRANLMKKMGADTVSELISMIIRLR